MAKLTRGPCIQCGEMVPVRRNGAAREHRNAKTKRTCAGSGFIVKNHGAGGAVKWDADLEAGLRIEFTKNPRTAIAAFAKVTGIKRGAVKARAKALGLLSSTSSAGNGRVSKTAPGRTAAAEPQERHSAGEASDGHVGASLQHAKCAKCKTRASWDPTDTPEAQVALGFTKGFTEDGMPICPHCRGRVPMVSLEATDAVSAVKQVLAAIASEQPALFGDLFNVDGAYRVLTDKLTEIEALQEDYDDKRAVAQKAKKTLDTANRQLLVISREFEQRRKQHVASQRQRRDVVETKADAICSFERHVGKPCPLCRGVSRSLAIANLAASPKAYRDLESEAHRAAAAKANSIEPARLTDLAPVKVAAALQIAGLYGIPPSVITPWSDADRLAVLAWVEGDQAGDPPAQIGTPHVAAPAGTEAQACATCGAVLLNLREGGVAYRDHALVGMHCPGLIPAAPTAEAATVPA